MASSRPRTSSLRVDIVLPSSGLDSNVCPAEAGAGSGDGGSRTLLLGASEVFFQKNLIPVVVGRAVRTGGVEPPQSVTLRLQRSELAGARRPRERVARVGFEPTVSSS